MPARVNNINGKWRVTEPGGQLVKRNGSAVDGGGHQSKEAAAKQAAAINARMYGPKRKS